MTGQLRILMTGGRGYDDRDTAARAVAEAVGDYGSHLAEWNPTTERMDIDWSGVTVVVGDCPTGLDEIARQLCKAWGMRCEVHKANWERFGRAAGPRRNIGMVERGAHVCLGFPRGESRGTRGCMAMAERAGIPVRVFGDVEVPS